MNFKKPVACLLSTALTWTSIPWNAFALDARQGVQSGTPIAENYNVNTVIQNDRLNFALSLNSILTDKSFANGQSIADIIRSTPRGTFSAKVEPHLLGAFIADKISEAANFSSLHDRQIQISAGQAIWDAAVHGNLENLSQIESDQHPKIGAHTTEILRSLASEYVINKSAKSVLLDSWKTFFDGIQTPKTNEASAQFSEDLKDSVSGSLKTTIISSLKPASQRLNFSPPSRNRIPGSNQSANTESSNLITSAPKRAKIALALSPLASLGLGAGYLLALGIAWHHIGIPFAAAAGFFLVRQFLAPFSFAGNLKETEQAGGKILKRNQAPEVVAEIEDLAKQAGIPVPLICLMPQDFNSIAQAAVIQGYSRSLLLITRKVLTHPQRRIILAHEIQHIRDAQIKSPWATFGFSSPEANILLRIGAISLMVHYFFGPLLGVLAVVKAIFGSALILTSIPFGGKILYWIRTLLLEIRGDLGAVRLTGDAASLTAARSKLPPSFAPRLVTKAVRFILGLTESGDYPRNDTGDEDSADSPPPANAFGRARLDFARPARPSQSRNRRPRGRGSAADKTPAYYQKAPPDWAKKLSLNPDESFSTSLDFERYKGELEKLRPLARWMAHFYLQLKQDKVERHPNILTIQDILNWAKHIRKFQAMQGWTLKDIAIDGVNKMFEETLPVEPYEGRDLRQEVKAKLQDLSPVLNQLPVPEHLEEIVSKSEAARGESEPASQPSEVQERDEEPDLFETKEVEGLDPPEIIVTPTVQKRLEDLLTLYSTDYKKKLFPLIIGPTSEGKSSLIKHMFADPVLKMNPAIGGRAIPVVSVPVKEAMTRRELLGGLTTEGIELGLLSNAVKYGWVLVLEESDQASGEFKKALNSVVHQIQKQGYFEFELGGKTIRINAHPHFWLVQTQNGEEGNYSFTRNPNAPDYMKRFVIRYYDRLPAPEQAQIMYGLAVKWYGKEFVDRQGLTAAFFEQKLVTRFHKPLRDMVDAGSMGGDFQEPYEFNRRTLHRFLRRYLYDLWFYESTGRNLDDKARKKLLARELMEAYGTEVRLPGEKQAIWDHMNKVFSLQRRYKIELKDIEINVHGIYRNGNKLIVQEELMPMEFPIRQDGGPRVPGPEYRLTAIPSELQAEYRSLRNRQFHEPEYSIGPTGAAKTTGQYAIAHRLGEPLFYINMDEQTGSREFHGGFVKDPATGNFRFVSGILARAFMFDPKGLLKPNANGKRKLTPAEARKSPHIGGTLVVDEASANTIVETINPAIDDHVGNLSDGQHSAVAGGASHVVLVTNPVGEGYAGYPLTEALRSRFQTVAHSGDWQEEELTEIILDQLTGFTRHELRPEVMANSNITSKLKTAANVLIGAVGVGLAGLSALAPHFWNLKLGFSNAELDATGSDAAADFNSPTDVWMALQKQVLRGMKIKIDSEGMKKWREAATEILRNNSAMPIEKALSLALARVQTLTSAQEERAYELFAYGIQFLSRKIGWVRTSAIVQGRILLGTLTGLYELKGNAITPIRQEAAWWVETIVQAGNKILVGATDGLYELERNNLVPIGSGITGVESIAVFENKILVGSEQGLFELRNLKENGLVRIASYAGWVFAIVPVGKKILLGTGTGLYELKGDVFAPILREMGLSIWTIVPADNKILVGTSQGLFELKGENLRPIQEGIGIWTIVPIGNRILVGATNGIYELKKNVLEPIWQSREARRAQVRSILRINERIFAGTSQGYLEMFPSPIEDWQDKLLKQIVTDIEAGQRLRPQTSRETDWRNEGSHIIGKDGKTIFSGLHVSQIVSNVLHRDWKKIFDLEIKEAVERNSALYLNTGRGVLWWSPSGIRPPDHWQNEVAESLGSEIAQIQASQVRSPPDKSIQASSDGKTILSKDGRAIFTGLRARQAVSNTLRKAAVLFGNLKLGFSESRTADPWRDLADEIREESGWTLEDGIAKRWKVEAAEILRNEPILSVEKALAQAFANIRRLTPGERENLEKLLSGHPLPILQGNRNWLMDGHDDSRAYVGMEDAFLLDAGGKWIKKTIPHAGMILDLIRFNGKRYAGTESGVYVEENGKWEKVFQGHFCRLTVIAGTLHTATSAGIYSQATDGEWRWDPIKIRRSKRSLRNDSLSWVTGWNVLDGTTYASISQDLYVHAGTRFGPRWIFAKDFSKIRHLDGVSYGLREAYSNGGLYAFDGGEWRDLLVHGPVKDAAKVDGRIWVVTEGKIKVETDKEWKPFLAGIDDISQITESDGNVYLNARSGVFRLNPAQRERLERWPKTMETISQQIVEEAGRQQKTPTRQFSTSAESAANEEVILRKDGRAIFSGLQVRRNISTTLRKAAAAFGNLKLGFADTPAKTKDQPKNPDDWDIWSMLEDSIRQNLNLQIPSGKTGLWAYEATQILRDRPALGLPQTLAEAFGKVHGLNSDQVEKVQSFLAGKPITEIPISLVYNWKMLRAGKSLYGILQGGLYRQEKDGWTLVRRPPDPTYAFSDIIEFKGDIYIAGQPGVLVWRKGKWSKELDDKVGGPINLAAVYHLASLNGVLYAAMNTGLWAKKGKDWTRILADWIRDVVELDGKLYVVTHRDEIFELEPGGHSVDKSVKTIFSQFPNGEIISHRLTPLQIPAGLAALIDPQKLPSLGFRVLDGVLYIIGGRRLLALKGRTFSFISPDHDFKHVAKINGILFAIGDDWANLYEQKGNQWIKKTILGAREVSFIAQLDDGGPIYLGTKDSLGLARWRPDALPAGWENQVAEDLSHHISQTQKTGELAQPPPVKADDGRAILDGKGRTIFSGLKISARLKSLFGNLSLSFSNPNDSRSVIDQNDVQALEHPHEAPNEQNIWSTLERNIQKELNLPLKSGESEAWARKAISALRSNQEATFYRALAEAFVSAHDLDRHKIQDVENLLEAMSGNPVMEIEEDIVSRVIKADGTAYAAIGAGVYRRDGTRWKLLFAGNYVLNDLAYFDGKLYAATRSERGVLVWDVKKRRKSRQLEHESVNLLRVCGPTMYAAADSGLWTKSRGGHWRRRNIAFPEVGVSSVRDIEDVAVSKGKTYLVLTIPYQVCEVQPNGRYIKAVDGSAGIQHLEIIDGELYGMSPLRVLRQGKFEYLSRRGIEHVAKINGTFYAADKPNLYKQNGGRWDRMKLVLDPHHPTRNSNWINYIVNLEGERHAYIGGSPGRLYRWYPEPLVPNLETRIWKDLNQRVSQTQKTGELAQPSPTAAGDGRSILDGKGHAIFSGLRIPEKIRSLFGNLTLGFAKSKSKDNENEPQPTHNLPLEQQLDAYLKKYNVPQSEWGLRKKLTIEAVDRIRTDIPLLAGTPHVPVRYGEWWMMIEYFGNHRLKEIVIPVEDIFVRAVDKKGVEECVAAAAHEAGHYLITHPDDNSPLVEKYALESSPPENNALSQAIEDVRNNTWVLLQEPGLEPYYDALYDAEWPANPEDTEALKRARMGILAGSKVEIETPKGKKTRWIPPHIQYVDSIIYHWRHKQLPPFLTDPLAREIFEETIPSLERIRNTHPQEVGGILMEPMVVKAWRDAYQAVDTEIYPRYQELIKESRKQLIQMIKSGAKISMAGGKGAISIDPKDKDLDEQTKKILEKISKEVSKRIKGSKGQGEGNGPPASGSKGSEASGSKETSSGSGEEDESWSANRKKAIDENKSLKESFTSYERYRLRAKELGLIGKVDGIIKKILLPTTHVRLSRSHYHEGDEPDLDKHLNDIAQGHLDTPVMRVWNRRIRRTAKIGLVLDISGSMGDLTEDMTSKLDYALLGIVAWVEVCQKNNIDFELILFDHDQHTVHHYGKKLNREGRDKLVKDIVELRGGTTAIGAAFKKSLDSILKQRATHRFILFATDEEHNTGEAPETWMPEAKKNGIITIAMVIGGDAKKFKHFDYAVRVKEPKEFPRDLLEVLKKAIRSILGPMARWMHF